MAGHLAIKRLSASDLTLFAYQYREVPAGNQKALNLNANIFVGKFYPALRQSGDQDRFPIDLYLYGPGTADEYNLQRKILKQEKNWRLDGEMIHNPEDQPQRFDHLAPNDLAVFEFNDAAFPDTVRVLFLSASSPEDGPLIAPLNELLGTSSMVSVSVADLERVLKDPLIAPDHALRGFVISADPESLILEGPVVPQSLVSMRARPRLSFEALQRIRESAGRLGRLGEELVNDYLQALRDSGQIHSFEWVSRIDAISPYDFWFSMDGQDRVLLDVKATKGDFDRALHVSHAELKRMADGPERYDLYRVFAINEGNGSLRVAKDTGGFARSILATLEQLPAGVFADGVTIAPAMLMFTQSSIVLNKAEDVSE